MGQVCFHIGIANIIFPFLPGPVGIYWFPCPALPLINQLHQGFSFRLPVRLPSIITAWQRQPYPQRGNKFSLFPICIPLPGLILHKGGHCLFVQHRAVLLHSNPVLHYTGIQFYTVSVPVIYDLRAQPPIGQFHLLHQGWVLPCQCRFLVAAGFLQVNGLLLGKQSILDALNGLFCVKLGSYALRYNLITSCLLRIFPDISILGLLHISLLEGLPVPDDLFQ